MTRRLVLGAGLAVVCGWVLVSAQGEPPRKYTYPRMTSQLSALVDESFRLGPAAERSLAGKAPLSDSGEVAVTIWAPGNAADLATALLDRSIRVTNSSADTVEAYVPLRRLPEIANEPGVLRVAPIMPPVSQAIPGQGRIAHNVVPYHATGLTGRGVRVGIIDLGFGEFRKLLGSELPPFITTRCYFGNGDGQWTTDPTPCDASPERHGAAVAEAVIDIAPSAILYFSNPSSLLETREAVRWMLQQGVRVINYSVGRTWDGPGDGTSVFDDSMLRTVDEAVNGGATFVAAAGNSGQSTWSGPFVDANANGWIEMSGLELNRIVGASEQVIVQLRWDDRWPGAMTDLDLFVYDENQQKVAESIDPQTGQSGEIPGEILVFTADPNRQFRIGVQRFSGSNPAWVDVQVFSQQALERHTPARSIANPAESGNLGVLAVGAADWRNLGFLEPFSSQGPTRDNRFKPDIVGADRADSASYGPLRFSGTSQAAPHVTGLVAMLRQLAGDQAPGAGFSAEQAAAAAIFLGESRGPRPNTAWGFGFAKFPSTVSAGSPVPFPPRDQTAAFRQELELEYTAMGWPLFPTYADREGALVWTHEYVRYRVNMCDINGSVVRILAQINRRGVPAVCGQPLPSEVVVPLRDEVFRFRAWLEVLYRDVLRFIPTFTRVDMEGDAVWISEYLRYRMYSCSHPEATRRTIKQVRKQGIEPGCGPILRSQGAEASMLSFLGLTEPVSR